MTKRISNQYYPETVSPPGETLLETIQHYGMSQTELAKRTGRPIKTINEIINGKAEITHDTALQLERVLGVPATFWNNRESNYRDYLARQKDANDLLPKVGWLDKMPVKELTKRNWIEPRPDKLDQLREVLKFFGVTRPELAEVITGVNFHRSTSFKSEPVALACWLRKGEIEAQAQHGNAPPFSADVFRSVLQNAKHLTTADPKDFIHKLPALCKTAGVILLFIEELPKCFVCGATRWIGEKPLIQLSCRYKSDDQFWFTFFHEAGHLLLHGKKDIFIDEEKRDTSVAQEAEANGFASRFLINQSHFTKFITERDFTAASIRKFAASEGISPGVVVGRLQHDKLIPWQTKLNSLKRRLIWQDGRLSHRKT